MAINKTKSALVCIDMEYGFVDERSAHCIAMAKESVPACIKTITLAREKGIPVFFVKRLYRNNGSDVELTRYDGWVKGGKAMNPGSTGFTSAEAPEGMKPQPGDYTIIKPRWSAFFGTELDVILRRLHVENVILIGTTTPNCVRTSAYDANALEYNVVIVEDACSSATKEIQDANIADLKRMGAVIMSSEEFVFYDSNSVRHMSDEIYKTIEENDIAPENFECTKDGNVLSIDRW